MERYSASSLRQRQVRFIVVAVFLLSCLSIAFYYVVSPPPARGISSSIVISQLYGGGGNSGSTYKNDFIELFNLGGSTVSVAGWSVQYASATGTTWQVTNLSGSIAPGHYYLVQEAQGAGGTTNLPTPDATGTIAMSATAGKVALVNSTTALSGACPSGASIVDFGGFGTTANCFEGSGPTPAPSNTTAVLRAANGCTDTDNNASDFSAGAPNPRNSASATNVCTNAPVTPTCPASLATTVGTAASGGVSATDSDGTVTGASITSITPSDPGTITLTGFTPAGGVGGTASATLQVSNTTPIGNYSVTITWSNNDSPTPQTATCTVAVMVNGAPVAIHDIQGSGTTSPLVGTMVTTSGIVTGIKSNGFFIQTPDANVDADPNTSEGIFVFTSSAPPAAAAIGNSVSVTGTVQEFIPSADPNSPPSTEIAGSPSVSFTSSGNTLPAPITLTASDTSPAGSVEQLEKFEGMRVHVNSLTVIAPTQGTVNETNATSTSNGVFYGVITGVARPFREPGVEVPDPLPAGSPCCVPRFDANPERLRVDGDGQTGATALEVTAGATVTNLTGPLDYAFRTYTILPDAATPPSVSGNISAIPVPAPAANEFTVASFNMERFFDTVDDPGTQDAVLTTTAFNNRLNKASLAIRNVLHTPDVLGVEEMENLTTLQAVATKVNGDAVANGDPNPNYQAYLVEGNDIGGIDVGFLVKSSRVTVIDVTQFGKTTTYINPNNGQPELLNDRPPLVLRATIPPPAGPVFPITVIVNHLRSLSGIDDPTDGNRVRTKRRAQAEYLANLIQARQMADLNEHIVSIGDYNVFQFNDGYVDSIGTIKGTPTPADQVVLASSDLVNPDLTDLIDFASADQRYSFSFDGNAQALDHELITANLLTRFSHINYARNDADFPESFRNDPNRPERISDHDMAVAYFTFPVPCAMTCPQNKAQSNDSNQCGAVVTYSAPTTTGECGTINCSPASGAFFPVGVTTVTCTESVSNGASCTFTVTVNDTQPPAITCPTNITKPTDPDKCSAVVTYAAPAVSDNCSSPTAPKRKRALTVTPLAPVCNPASGSTFPKGTTTVTCTVSDASGNQASCQFTVTVNDTQAPVFPNDCPANIFTAAAASCPIAMSKVVSYTYPVATDNCPAVTVTCNPPTGSTFAVGTTTVNCTATDTSGNTSTCSFQVSVFSLCLVDDSNPGNVVLFNAIPRPGTNVADYRYCCNGMVTATGSGSLTSRGCIVTIDHSKGDRKVRISADTSANNGAGSGTAFIQKSGAPFCQITTRSMAGSVCNCN